MPIQIPQPNNWAAIRPSAKVGTIAGLLDCHPCDIRRLVDAGELQAHTKGTRGVRVFLDSVAEYQERQARAPRLNRKAGAVHPQRKPPSPTVAFRTAMAGLKAKGLA